MHSSSTIIVVVCLSLAALSHGAEEPMPSDRMKQAIGKLNKAPASIGQSLQGLTDAAATKLKQLSGSDNPAPQSNAIDMTVPQKKTDIAPPAHVMKPDGRDPFRPMALKTNAASRSRENLSPLERFDIGQLKIVGIVSDVKEPRAMVEDSAGLGYTVKVGTPIGSNDGRVKVIGRDQIVIEEVYVDAYGARKKRDIAMRLSTE
ncbi:MAG TPA: pilus assembly protein PilP [Candidatus Binatia bacterium]|jgi:type IV pilus assembly protein PilP|nr:pilus assembly protein PilP [Candidatus Binatia bacterium]